MCLLGMSWLLSWGILCVGCSHLAEAFVSGILLFTINLVAFTLIHLSGFLLNNHLKLLLLLLMLAIQAGASLCVLCVKGSIPPSALVSLPRRLGDDQRPSSLS